MLLCVSVVTRKLDIFPIKQQNLICLIQALEMLLFWHGQVNLILDQHKTGIALGFRPRVTELSPEYHTRQKLPTLFNILHDNKVNLLAQKGITIKVSSGNYHREVGLSERAVYKVKQLIINNFRNKLPAYSIFSIYVG